VTEWREKKARGRIKGFANVSKWRWQQEGGPEGERRGKERRRRVNSEFDWQVNGGASAEAACARTRTQTNMQSREKACTPSLSLKSCIVCQDTMQKII